MADADRDEVLALVHRGWDHLKLQRPLAAWASWQRALRHDPDDRAAREALAILAAAEDLPAAARQVYRFRPPLGEERRARWDEELRGRDLADLDEAAASFGALAEADPDDGAAAYNLGLCLAWLGENRAAIEALDRSVAATASEAFEAAVEAWALAEILRQGGGAERLADDVRYSLSIVWSDEDGEPIEWLSGFATLREVEVPTDPGFGPAPAGVRTFEWLNRVVPEARPGLSAADLPRVLCTVIAIPGQLKFSSPVFDGLEAASRVIMIARPVGRSPFNHERTPLPIPMMDAAVGRLRLPPGLDEAERRRLIREAVEDEFENEWIYRKRWGLAGVHRTTYESQSIEPPFGASLVAIGRFLDRAAIFLEPPRGHLSSSLTNLRSGNDEPVAPAIARAKLEGIIRVREQLASRPRAAPLYAGYPFDRLRRRLGLELIDPAAIDPDDVSCMGLADLERLDPSRLDDATLAEAFVSAKKLVGVGSAAGRLAEELVNRDATSLVRVDVPHLAEAWFVAARNAEERRSRHRLALEIDDERGIGLVRRSLTFRRANRLESSGKHARAARAVIELAARFPDDARLAYSCAFFLHDTSDWEPSLILFREAIERAKRTGDLLTEKEATLMVDGMTRTLQERDDET